jgi:hypothetical protein
MNRITGKSTTHDVRGGVVTRKRNEPHDRYQVEIYLKLETGINRRGVEKTRGRPEISCLVTASEEVFRRFGSGRFLGLHDGGELTQE